MFQFQYGAIGRILLFFILIMRDHVSIPVWCDWERVETLIVEYRHVFQFQYGAIGSKHQQHLCCLMLSFNSSMVRLGEITASSAAQRMAVSIPVWCDWENPKEPLILMYDPFQFQYGAIGRCFCISICPFCFSSFNSSMVRLGAIPIE